MIRRLAFSLLLATITAPVLGLAADQNAQPVFVVSFAASARTEAVTGRMYVAISRVNDRPPIRQAGPTGTPLFAVSVDQVTAGTDVRFSPQTPGYPVATLGALPAGEYWVQPFVNVYTRFPRADGHVGVVVVAKPREPGDDDVFAGCEIEETCFPAFVCHRARCLRSGQLHRYSRQHRACAIHRRHLNASCKRLRKCGQSADDETEDDEDH
jgi:hypothetical protein